MGMGKLRTLARIAALGLTVTVSLTEVSCGSNATLGAGWGGEPSTVTTAPSTTTALRPNDSASPEVPAALRRYLGRLLILVFRKSHWPPCRAQVPDLGSPPFGLRAGTRWRTSNDWSEQPSKCAPIWRSAMAVSLSHPEGRTAGCA